MEVHQNKIKFAIAICAGLGSAGTLLYGYWRWGRRIRVIMHRGATVTCIEDLQACLVQKYGALSEEEHHGDVILAHGDKATRGSGMQQRHSDSLMREDATFLDKASATLHQSILPTALGHQLRQGVYVKLQGRIRAVHQSMQCTPMYDTNDGLFTTNATVMPMSMPLSSSVGINGCQGGDGGGAVYGGWGWEDGRPWGDKEGSLACVYWQQNWRGDFQHMHKTNTPVYSNNPFHPNNEKPATQLVHIKRNTTDVYQVPWYCVLEDGTKIRVNMQGADLSPLYLHRITQHPNVQEIGLLHDSPVFILGYVMMDRQGQWVVQKPMVRWYVVSTFKESVLLRILSKRYRRWVFASVALGMTFTYTALDLLCHA